MNTQYKEYRFIRQYTNDYRAKVNADNESLIDCAECSLEEKMTPSMREAYRLALRQKSGM